VRIGLVSSLMSAHVASPSPSSDRPVEPFCFRSVLIRLAVIPAATQAINRVMSIKAIAAMLGHCSMHCA
jgi:hypothetical protein